MYRWMLLLLLIPSSLLAQGVNDAEWAKLAYNEGQQYEADRDWVNALRLYEAAVGRASKIAEYRYRAAYAAVQLKEFGKAQSLIEPTLSSEHAPLWSLYATLLLQQGKTAQAKEWFQKALLLEPGSPQPYFGLAQCAEADWKAGDAAAKSHAIAHYQAYLGRAIDGSQRNEAEARLRELQYGTPGVELNQAIRVLATGQDSRAERMLQKLTPHLKEAFYWLGVIAQKREDAVAARGYWESALPLPMAQLALARQQMERGEHAKALDYLQAAQRLAPNLVEVSLDLGRVYLELRRDQEAEEWLRRVVRDAPQRPEARRAQALLEQLGGKISPQEPDWSIGRLTEAQLLQRYGGELYDVAKQNRLEALIQRLRAGTPELASRRFQVRILQSNVPNAWPVPPNKILITQGLIQFVDTSPDLRRLADDVLAFILGHEITHLIEHDTEKAGELQALGGGDVTEFRVRQAILHRTEYNADRRGALIAYQAQFDPFAAVVWCRASQNRYGDSPEGSDHPTFSQRQAELHRFLSQDVMEAHRQFKNGVALLQGGDAARAANAFEMYLAQLPTDSEAQYNLALAYFLQGIAQLSKPPWAPWELASEIAVKPLFAEPYAKRMPLDAERWIKRAQIEVKLILQQHPSHTASWRLLGDIALAYRELTTAREHYRQALRVQPDDAATQNNLGVLECLEKRWQEARQQFQSCLQQQNPTTQSVARRNLEQLR